MLSGETASGRYPLKAVETMARVAAHVDQALNEAELDTPPAASQFRSSRCGGRFLRDRLLF